MSASMMLFQFTHPGRGATLILTLDNHGCLVSIHAPREGCDWVVDADRATLDLVSIHAPREGCDAVRWMIVGAVRSVSIHAPREGCDRAVSRDPGTQDGFNSRTPGGVRHRLEAKILKLWVVSIHAPREGCD